MRLFFPRFVFPLQRLLEMVLITTVTDSLMRKCVLWKTKEEVIHFSYDNIFS